MGNARPGPAHERLGALVGEWEGEEEFAATPWAPAGTARSRHSFRSGVGGLAVIHDYAQVRDGEPFDGHGFFTADPGTGEVVWFFFDGVGFPPDVPLRGDWDADGVLRLAKTTPRGQARHAFRFDGDTFEHEIDVRLGDAETFSPFARGRFRRV
ncbi:Protein of unknown function (DUF1579) [Streptoalloteichus tenebrarius]|uniref:DUF1579 domain-containing protein n=1 Tax=Streptoalloteichus tenebrarius (strain ATCC 17920 / DSM 40477 / JCM 4838 / CBS 697.72 / NBRC 16177 / NCIMB 11028 / NRRL B-12390 / A12253. 1 / ISP 5477) TaxID=1933 RepID=A0ABT1I279_STRSD|nr:DUF1579 family protein [Streptoalloteichus tenebrarius]MCP2261899.1 Protein of unknown function (DUF1579) [Streptoalloteichus tenebrarius]BFF01039.1 DUF1579 family protein [Streptoalloteichus tenebrarius]